MDNKQLFLIGIIAVVLSVIASRLPIILLIIVLIILIPRVIDIIKKTCPCLNKLDDYILNEPDHQYSHSMDSIRYAFYRDTINDKKKEMEGTLNWLYLFIGISIIFYGVVIYGVYKLITLII